MMMCNGLGTRARWFVVVWTVLILLCLLGLSRYSPISVRQVQVGAGSARPWDNSPSDKESSTEWWSAVGKTQKKSGHPSIKSYLSTLDTTCKEHWNTVSKNASIWYVCTETAYAIKDDGLAYSYSVNKNSVAEQLMRGMCNCSIRIYTPTLAGNSGQGMLYQRIALRWIISNMEVPGDPKKKWRADTLSNIREREGTDDKIIDYLNIDIDYDVSLSALRTMIYSQDLLTVKQIALTVHANLLWNDAAASKQALDTLNDLKHLGFLLWMVKPCSREVQDNSASAEPTCQRIFLLNSKMKSGKLMTPEYAVLPTLHWDVNDRVAEEQFQLYIDTLNYECKNAYRIGNAADGGWPICLDEGFHLSDPCLIYSFGINWDFSFDDGVSKQYGCKVKAYDPSMNKNDDVDHSPHVHFYKRGLGGKKYVNKKGWKMNTFGGFLEETGGSGKAVDYLKIDIEYSEWEALEAMLTEGSLAHVKQFGLEIHTEELFGKMTNASVFEKYYSILHGVENLGFRKWSLHKNQYGMYNSKRTGNRQTCCYEFALVNVNFLKQPEK